MSKLSLDMFLTLVRYLIIAWGLKQGFSNELNEALVGAGVTMVTMAWGFHASGYWHRLVEWFKS